MGNEGRDYKPVCHIGTKFNDGNWIIDDNTGNDFENAVYAAMVRELRPLFDSGVRIQQTNRSGDRGKDIVVYAPCELKTLGRSFTLNGKESILIHIECKSSNQKEPLRPSTVLDSIASDTSSFTDLDKSSRADYYVLATNSTLTPESFWKLNDELRLRDVQFRLVDRYLLARYLDSQKCSIGDIDLVNLNVERTLSLEYQYRARTYEMLPGYELTILCRNYTDQSQAVCLILQTDIGWNLPNNEEFTLPPNGSCTAKLHVIRKINDGIRDLRLTFRMGALSHSVVLEYGGKPILVPNLCGRIDEILRLKKWLDNAKAFSVFYLTGEAGTGKTRILDELCQRMTNSNYHFKWLKATGGKNTKLWKSLRSFMRDKGYTDVSSESPADLLQSANHPSCTLVIIIDDIHRGNEAFYLALREMIELQGRKIPVRVILCGRVECDVFNCDYFAYLDWLSAHTCSNARQMELGPLSTNDTMRLTKMLIEDLPDSVLEHIVDRSSNKPLFVIQFAEYLLEANLATMRSRGTIGITDPSSLQRNRYLPRTIEEIYENRFKFFKKKTADYGRYRDIVFTMAELDGTLEEDIYHAFFSEEDAAIDDLKRRQIIVDDGKGGYRFVHETMLIFFQKKLSNESRIQRAVADRLLENDSIARTYLDDLRLGKLNFWRKRIKRARGFLLPYLDEVSEYHNLSHFNPDLRLYPYLFVLYDVFKKSNVEGEALRNALRARIYIALHHLSPVRAIEDAEEALSRLSNSSCDRIAAIDIAAQKAHALLQTGQSEEGEGVIDELLSKRLLDNSSVSPQALFDMYDRLCIINIGKNRASVARNYNDLSLRIAEELEDKSIEAIGYRTRSKLCFHLNLEESIDCLDHVDAILKKGFDRIDTCNKVARQTAYLVKDPSTCLEVLRRAEELLDHSVSEQYAWVTSRAYLLIAACNLIEGSQKNLKKARNAVNAGIDSAVHYGVANGLWQFYNLLGIIDTHLGYDIPHVRSTFMTVRAILQRQGLFRGCLEKPCHGNILAISNLGSFLANEMNESEFCLQIHAALPGLIYASNSPYRDEGDIHIGPQDYEKLQKEFTKAQEQKLLFTNKYPDGVLKDKDTGYYISLG